MKPCSSPPGWPWSPPLSVHLQQNGPAPWCVEARAVASFGRDLGRHGKAGRLGPTASPGPSPRSAPLTGVCCSALPVRKVKHTCSLCAVQNKQADGDWRIYRLFFLVRIRPVHCASAAAPPWEPPRGLLWLWNRGYRCFCKPSFFLLLPPGLSPHPLVDVWGWRIEYELGPPPPQSWSHFTATRADTQHR